MDMMVEYQVVGDKMSRFGLRGVHVVSYGGPVGWEELARDFGLDGERVEAKLVYREEEVGIWHSWVWARQGEGS